MVLKVQAKSRVFLALYQCSLYIAKERRALLCPRSGGKQQYQQMPAMA